MRTFTKRDKEIIDKIYNQAIGDDDILLGGKILFRNGFYPKEDILLLVPDLKYACFLFKSEYNNISYDEYATSYAYKIGQIVRNTIDTISLLDYLEEKGMIYVYERTGDFKDVVLYFGDVQQNASTYTPHNESYVCHLNSQELTFDKYNDYEIALRDKDRNITMHGFGIKEGNTCNKLFHFYNGCIFATSALKELKENNYKTDEEIALDQAKRQSKLAIHSLSEAKKQNVWARYTFCISYLALVASIIIPIVLNKYTTLDVRIEEKQFNSLIKDSVISEKVDSSLYYIKKISAQSAEAQKTAKQDSVKNTKSGKEQKSGKEHKKGH